MFTFEASSGLSVTVDDKSSLTSCAGLVVVLDGLLLKFPFVTFINIFRFVSDLCCRLCFWVGLSYVECSKRYNIAIVKAKIWENIRANRHNLEHWRILKWEWKPFSLDTWSKSLLMLVKTSLYTTVCCQVNVVCVKKADEFYRSIIQGDWQFIWLAPICLSPGLIHFILWRNYLRLRKNDISLGISDWLTFYMYVHVRLNEGKVANFESIVSVHCTTLHVTLRRQRRNITVLLEKNKLGLDKWLCYSCCHKIQNLRITIFDFDLQLPHFHCGNTIW